MGKRFSDVKRFSDEKKWEDEVEWFGFPDGKMVLVRTFGDIEVLARHWVRTMSGKMFPVWCPRLNREEEFDHTRPCPAHADFEDKSQKMMLTNAIIRQQQERGDPNPVKGIMLPHAVMDEIAQIAQLVKADPSDDKKGVDLAITFHSKAVGNKKWSIQRGDTTPLTDTELGYRSYGFRKIVPDFDDPEVCAQYARNMKEAMARHKYYVAPEGRVPENARDPFKYFRGDPRGQPWTDYPVLVDYRNAEKGESAGTYRVSRQNDAPREAPREALYNEDEPARTPPPARAARADRPADTAAGQDADEPGAPGVDFGAAAAASESRQDAGDRPKPECFGRYHGGDDCKGCDERARCIIVTDDDDM